MVSISKDSTVESSITNYCENKEPLINCYKYNKPIRSTIFNFNKLVHDGRGIRTWTDAATSPSIAMYVVSTICVTETSPKKEAQIAQIKIGSYIFSSLIFYYAFSLSNGGNTCLYNHTVDIIESHVRLLIDCLVETRIYSIYAFSGFSLSVYQKDHLVMPNRSVWQMLSHLNVFTAHRGSKFYYFLFIKRNTFHILPTSKASYQILINVGQPMFLESIVSMLPCVVVSNIL